MKDREAKIKREIEYIFIRPIIVSIDDMDKFGQNKIKKTRPIKNTYYKWLTNYILDPIRKSRDGFKDNIVSHFNANTI